MPDFCCSQPRGPQIAKRKIPLLHDLKLAIAYPGFHAALAQNILTEKRRALSGCI